MHEHGIQSSAHADVPTLPAASTEKLSLDVRLRGIAFSRREILIILGAGMAGAAGVLAYKAATDDGDQFSKEVLAFDVALTRIEDAMNERIKGRGRVPLTPKGKLAFVQQFEGELDQVMNANALVMSRAPSLVRRMNALRNDMQQSKVILQGLIQE